MLAKGWHMSGFLKFAFVQNVNMCVFVQLLQLYINCQSHDYDFSNDIYNFYMGAVDGIISWHGLGIKVYHRNQYTVIKPR